MMNDDVLALQQRIQELENQLAAVRQPPEVERASLAQGNDPVKLRFTFAMRDNSKGYLDSDHPLNLEQDLECTWNDVFRYLAPHLETGLPEITLRNVLARFGDEHVPLNIRNRSDNYKLFSARITTPAFSTIKIQFIALGLIESFRNESGLHRLTSWRLTPAGRTEMYKLYAVKKSDLTAR